MSLRSAITCPDSTDCSAITETFSYQTTACVVGIARVGVAGTGLEVGTGAAVGYSSRSHRWQGVINRRRQRCEKNYRSRRPLTGSSQNDDAVATSIWRVRFRYCRNLSCWAHRGRWNLRRSENPIHRICVRSLFHPSESNAAVVPIT